MKSKGYSITRRWNPETWWREWEERQQKPDPRAQFRRAAINDFRRQLDVASPRPAPNRFISSGSGTGQTGAYSSYGQPPSISWSESEAADLNNLGETEGLSQFVKARLPRVTPGAADNACSPSPGPAGDKVVGDG